MTQMRILPWQDIDEDWMSSALSQAFDSPVQVHDLSAEVIGTGKMGDNVRFRIDYAGDADTLPSTLVGKFPAEDPKAREMAGLQGAYYHEVMFYRHVAPRTSARVPRIYLNEIADTRTEFVTLMEDLAPAEPGSQFVPETQERARMALREAARFTATFYGSQEFAGADYIMSQAAIDGGAMGQALLQQYWPSFADRFGANFSSEMRAVGDFFAGHYQRYIASVPRAMSLVHGDLRSENLLFTDQYCVLVDWQTIAETSPLTDIAYFLGGSVTVEDRRAWERDLVAEFCEELARAGVRIEQEEAWRQYRLQSLHGLLIIILGASFSSSDARSDEMFRLLIERQLQQAGDLDAIALVTA